MTDNCCEIFWKYSQYVPHNRLGNGTNILFRKEVFSPYVGVQNCLNSWGIVTSNLNKKSVIYIRFFFFLIKRTHQHRIVVPLAQREEWKCDSEWLLLCDSMPAEAYSFLYRFVRQDHNDDHKPGQETHQS